MWSHSVTCHPSQVNTPRLDPSHTGQYSIYLPRRDERLSWSRCLGTYRDSLPVSRQSPIQVVTRFSVDWDQCVTTTPCSHPMVSAYWLLKAFQLRPSDFPNYLLGFQILATGLSSSSTSFSINHKSLCSIATSRLELLHNAVWQSRAEIRWWDLDTIGWRAMTWGVDRMTSMTELTLSPQAGRSRCVEQQPRKPGYRRRLVPAEHSVRRPCRSATATSGPRYRGALPCFVIIIIIIIIIITNIKTLLVWNIKSLALTITVTVTEIRFIVPR